jgi:hypothetical protein
MRWVNRLGFVLVGIAVAGAAVLYACQADRTISTEIVIMRPPSVVWRVLTATGDYSAWNPMIDKISGELREGNVIEVDQGMVFHPTVLTVHPDRELRWKGYVWTPGLFDGEHRFVLKDEDGHTRLIQSEIFSGVLAGRLTRGVIDETVAAMQEMNRAMKARAEAIGERAKIDAEALGN